MHTAILLIGFLAAWTLTALAPLWLTYLVVPIDRRAIIGWAFAAPFLILFLLAAGILIMYSRGCMLFSRWDALWSVPMSMAIVGLSLVGLGRNVVRTWRTRQQLRDISVSVVDPQVLAIVAAKAEALGRMPPPAVRQVDLDRPLAVSHGLQEPIIYLSIWVLTHLDPAELEAVLAHEMAHIALGDHVRFWSVDWLRRVFFFIPGSQRLWRVLHAEKEPGADDVAVSHTGKPAAMASALWKFHQYNEAPTIPQGAGFADDSALTLSRIQRLLDSAQDALPVRSQIPPRLVALAYSAYGVLILLALSPLAVMSQYWNHCYSGMG